MDFSIIIPTYNSGEKLVKMVNSILNQKINYKYEILIIDDGSSDNTKEIVKEFKSDIVKYHYTENHGVSHARNIGISKSRGNKILFADSDDLFNDGMINSYFENSIEFDLLIAGYRRISRDNNNYIDKYINDNTFEKKEYAQLVELAQNNNLFNQVWNKIYNKQIIDDNKLKFDESLSFGEDYKFNIEYLFFTDNCNVISNVVYIYYNDLNGLNNKYRRNRFTINKNNLMLLENKFVEYNYSMIYIYHKYYITTLSGINNACKNNNKKETKEDLIKICNDNDILLNLSKSKGIAAKLLLFFLKGKHLLCLKILSFFIRKYETQYKKRKLGY